MLYYELGRLPLQLIRKCRIFNYWLKLRTSHNCILNAWHNHMLKYNDPWVTNIKKDLFKLGLGYMWENN